MLAMGGLYASGLSFESISVQPQDSTFTGFLGAVALGILAYKGFTTITNSGGEIQEPHKNVGRAIMISIAICIAVYLLVAFAVGGNLTIDQIVQSKDYALAEAARPAFGQSGLWITVGFAIVATVSGVIASVFAVSRMLAMLTDMKLVPHSHFGMPGDVQKHTLVYTIVFAMMLTVFLRPWAYRFSRGYFLYCDGYGYPLGCSKATYVKRCRQMLLYWLQLSSSTLLCWARCSGLKHKAI